MSTCYVPGNILYVFFVLTKSLLVQEVILLSFISSQPRDQTHVSHIAGRLFTTLATREAHYCFNSVQSSSVTQLCLTVYDSMNRSTPGLPVHHQLPEFTQTHVRRVSDAIQPSHPLSSPFPPARNPSQHQSLFQWVTLLMRWPKYWISALASFLPKKFQGSSPSEWIGWISLQSKGLSRVFSNTTVQKHQFFCTQLSSQSNCHIHTWLLEKP